MIKAIIIDDEPLARSIIKEYLSTYKDIDVVDECDDGFQGAKSISRLQPDLVFLDIQMPKINGFEMLELLERQPPVIFTTAFDTYAIRAFETHAVDYLLKPFNKERFDKAVQRFLRPSSVHTEYRALLNEPMVPAGYLERIVVKTAGKIRIIPTDEILYVEAADDYVKIHCTDGSFLKNKTMAYFETSLPANLFVRTHRSYIVNVREITRIDPYEKDNHIAILRNGEKIPVSKNGYGKLRAALGI